jgi:hypothetical protein
MQKTCKMVTPELLQGQFTKDLHLHYFRHKPKGDQRLQRKLAYGPNFAPTLEPGWIEPFRSYSTEEEPLSTLLRYGPVLRE